MNTFSVTDVIQQFNFITFTSSHKPVRSVHWWRFKSKTWERVPLSHLYLDTNTAPQTNVKHEMDSYEKVVC